MRPVIHLLFFSFLALGLTGCKGCSADPRSDQTPPPSLAPLLPAKTAEQAKVEKLQTQLKDAEKAEQDAIATGKTTDRLVAENQQLQLRTQIAEEQQVQLAQYLDSLKRQKAESDKQVEAARVHDWQWRIYYVAMALGALGLVSLIVRWAWPLLATVAGWAVKIFAGLALAFTIVGKLLPYFVWFIDFLPYLLWPLGAVGVAYGVALFRQWWLDHHTANQFVGLIPRLKAAGVSVEQHMQAELDSPILAHVEKIGRKLANQATTLPAEIRAIAAVSAPGTPATPFPVSPLPASPAAGAPP